MKKSLLVMTALCAGLVLTLDSMPACAQETVIRNETTTTTTAPERSTTNVYVDKEEPVEKEVVVEEERRDGLLGGPIFHVVGEVLAFPFRLVGDVIDFIF